LVEFLSRCLLAQVGQELVSLLAWQKLEESCYGLQQYFRIAVF